MIMNPTSHFVGIGLNVHAIRPYFEMIERFLQKSSHSIRSCILRDPSSPHITLRYLPSILPSSYKEKLASILKTGMQKDISVTLRGIDFFLSRDHRRGYMYVQGFISNDALIFRDHITEIEDFPEISDNLLEFIPHITLAEVTFIDGFSDFNSLKIAINEYTSHPHMENVAETVALYVADSKRSPELQEILFYETIKK